jgi:hypothetical protein
MDLHDRASKPRLRGRVEAGCGRRRWATFRRRCRPC